MNLNSLGVRLKAARKGLGKNQDEMAAMCGVSREMWGKYERDVAMPGGDVLIKIALAGVDLNHLLTGQCSQPVPAKAELRPDQAALLDNYEHSDEVARQAAQRLLDPRSQRKKA